MKIADGTFSSEASGKKLLLPLIPSKDEKQEALTTLNSATFSLRAQLTDSDSPKYKFTIRKIDGSKTCRLLIEWFLAIVKIFTGLNVNAVTAA